MNIREVLNRTDWADLAVQKQKLVEAIGRLEDAGFKDTEDLEGILSWIDHLQDAASEEGFPVLYLTHGE